MIIGVDRLDYSKGLTCGSMRSSNFSPTFPDWRGKVTYLQITPQSRTGDPRICRDGPDGRRGGRPHQRRLRRGVDWTPIRYINKAHQPHRARRAFIAPRASGW